MNDLDVPKGSQPPSRPRFYIGSAAVFWFVVAGALLLRTTRFFYLDLPYKPDYGWLQASYVSVPALLAALLAIYIRNVSDHDLPPWIITPPVFVFVSYFMIIQEWK
jgi:hypothetical protein